MITSRVWELACRNPSVLNDIFHDVNADIVRLLAEIADFDSRGYNPEVLRNELERFLLEQEEIYDLSGEIGHTARELLSYHNRLYEEVEETLSRVRASQLLSTELTCSASDDDKRVALSIKLSYLDESLGTTMMEAGESIRVLEQFDEHLLAMGAASLPLLAILTEELPIRRQDDWVEVQIDHHKKALETCVSRLLEDIPLPDSNCNAHGYWTELVASFSEHRRLLAQLHGTLSRTSVQVGPMSTIQQPFLLAAPLEGYDSLPEQNRVPRRMWLEASVLVRITGSMVGPAGKLYLTLTPMGSNAAIYAPLEDLLEATEGHRRLVTRAGSTSHKPRR